MKLYTVWLLLMTLSITCPASPSTTPLPIIIVLRHDIPAPGSDINVVLYLSGIKIEDVLKNINKNSVRPYTQTETGVYAWVLKNFEPEIAEVREKYRLNRENTSIMVIQRPPAVATAPTSS